MSAITRWTVTGMTCAHCVNAVDEEVRRLEGVTDVEIDLATGTVSVTSVGPLAADAMADAVTEAGYDLVGP